MTNTSNPERTCLSYRIDARYNGHFAEMLRLHKGIDQALKKAAGRLHPRSNTHPYFCSQNYRKLSADPFRSLM